MEKYTALKQKHKEVHTEMLEEKRVQKNEGLVGKHK